jgi:hypothetical protein
MNQPLPTRCPLCDGRVHVERIRCEACGSAVEGSFDLDWLGQLSREQLKFVRIFLACRGKIKDVEQALGLSYPTVVARLDDVVAALGQRAGPPPRREPDLAAPAAAEAPDRLEVLRQLSAGDIDVDEAERRLKASGQRSRSAVSADGDEVSKGETA